MKPPDQLGPYRVEGVLGKGGMGRVYRATHGETGDAVAIKALSPQLAMNDGFIERFRAEIESLRMLKHASIVRLLGYGQEGDTLFYAMELVDGPSLEDELRQGRRFDWREVTDIGVQVCRALKHAHDHGVVHRDIKPANILLAPSGKAKLADFGIARLFGGGRMTVVGGVIGTADYMAPEQVAGDSVTPQADQYSLGGVLYALLAGRPPFVAKSLPEMLQLQRYAEPEPLRRYAADTPQQLEQAVMQMLRKEPGERFPNTLVLAKHLEAMRLALSRPPKPLQGDPAATPGEQAGDTPPAAAGPDGSTHGYDPSTEQIGPGDSESILIVDPEVDDDLTPAASLASSRGRGHDAPTLAAGDETKAPALAPRSLFTEVREPPPRDAEPRWALAAQGLAAVVLLGLAGWLGYRWLAPPDADTLHNRISATLARGDAGALHAASSDIEAFLRRFPDDPRGEALLPAREAIDLEQRERRLDLKLALRRTADTDAPPLEQLYFSAMRLAPINPGRAIEQLEALATLVESGAAGGDAAEGFGPLARRQIERLRTSAEKEATTHRPFVEAQIGRARELAGERPNEARELCEAVITLYATRPWAAGLVAEARLVTERLASP